jgi:hypothetical protein
MADETASQRYERLFGEIRVALPEDRRHLVRELDAAVGERLGNLDRGMGVLNAETGELLAQAWRRRSRLMAGVDN